jgi:hypothetical protein
MKTTRSGMAMSRVLSDESSEQVAASHRPVIQSCRLGGNTPLDA